MKYGVRLEGKNFEMNTDRGVENLGFITTRFVKARTPEEAEIKAVDLIKKDAKLTSALVKDRNLEPMIYLVEYWKESWWKKVGGSGYSFYPMEPESE